MSCSQQKKDTFHFYIRKGDRDKVKLIIDEYPQEKYFCNSEHESAAKTAIEHRKYVIYELLLSRGIWLRLGEDISAFYIDDRSKIELIHRKFFKDSNADHLIRLFSMSRLSHCSSEVEREKYNSIIINAFEDLNKSKWIEPILKVASISKDLKMMFDFDNDSNERSDENPKVEGVKTNKFIYIGAKDLIEDEHQNKVLGTIINELCHFAMEMIYNNDCKPYLLNDTKRHQEFSKIVKKFKFHKSGEDLIAQVYRPRYTVDKQHAELIVRVPHIIAFYFYNEKKYSKIFKKFPQLFDYYEKYVLADLQSQHPILEARRRIKELNDHCLILDSIVRLEILFNSTFPTLDLDASNKVLHLASNCPQVTMRAIYQQLLSQNNLNAYIFMTLKILREKEIRNCVAGVFNLCIQPTIVVDCDQSNQNLLNGIVKDFNVKGLTRRIIFVTDNKLNVPSVPSSEVIHLRKHFYTDYQVKCLLREVSFQGMNILLKDIIDPLLEDPIATPSKSEDLGQTLLDSLETQIKLINAMPLETRRIEIGTEITFDEQTNFIERTFLDEKKKRKSYYIYERLRSVGVLEMSELLEMSKNEQKSSGFLLCDKPGMGKSTVFQLLTKKLKEKFPSKWILYMDLKLHSRSYQKDECVSANFSNSEEILDFFCSNVINAGTLEKEVFKFLFDNNRVVILMDGFDEICPSYKIFALKLISGVKARTKTQVWISTRPNLMADLEPLMLTKLKLKPFDERDCKSFFDKFFENKNLGEGKSTKVLQRFEKFLKVPLNTFETSPLIMKLIAEVIDQDSFVLSSNLFSLYEQFEKKLLVECMSKGSEAKNDLANAISNQTLLNYFFDLSFRVVIGDEDDEIFKLYFRHMPKLPIDEIVRTGIVESDESLKLDFSHRSFAEFFVAKFLFTKLKQNDISEKRLKVIIRLFLSFIVDEYYSQSMVTVFLDHAFELLENDVVCIKNLQRFPGDLEHFFEDLSMADLIKSGCLNLIKWFSFHLISDPYSFWNKKFYDLTPLAKQSQQFFDGFWPLVKKYLSTDNLTKLLLAGNKSRSILHETLLSLNIQVFNSIVEKAEKILTPADFEKLLMSVDISNWNYLFYALDLELNFEEVFFILKRKLSSNQIKEMLKSRGRWFHRFFVPKEDRSLLYFATRKGENVANLKSFCDTLTEYLTDTNELRLFILDVYVGELILAAEFGNATFFYTLWTFISQIFEGTELLQFLGTEYTDLPVFYYAARSKKKDTFESVLQLYKEKFSNKRMKEIILAKYEDESILTNLMKTENDMSNRHTVRRCSAANLKALWSYILELLEIEEIKMLLNQSHRYCGTILERAAYYNKSFLGILKEFVDKHYSEQKGDKIRKLIESTSGYESQITELEDEF